MKALLYSAFAIGLFFYLEGYRVVWPPTPEQRFGCTDAQIIEQEHTTHHLGECP